MRPLRTLPLLWIVLLAACRAGPVATASATATAPRMDPPLLTPTPAFSSQLLDLTLRTADQPGDWLVVGLLQNASSFAVADIQLVVTLHGARGEALAEATVLPALRHLAPQEVTPFQARFHGVGAVTGAKAQVLVARREAVQRAELHVSDPEVFQGEDGRTLLLGRVTNPGDKPLVIHALAYVGMDAQAELRALAPQLHAPSWLDAGASSPFLAQADAGLGELRWIAFPDALVAAGPWQPAISLEGGARLLHTAQGRVFAVGDLVNSSGQSRDVSALLIISHEERVLSLSTLRAPFPISAGERLSFGHADFPGLSLRLGGIDPAELTLETWVDARASAPSSDQRVQLELQIDALESVGSAVFVRGAVVNARPVSLDRPSLQAALRTTEGGLLTAGWRQLAPRLAAGERMEFVVDLPFPRGADLAMAEFDLLAYAMQP